MRQLKNGEKMLSIGAAVEFKSCMCVDMRQLRTASRSRTEDELGFLRHVEKRHLEGAPAVPAGVECIQTTQ